MVAAHNTRRYGQTRVGRDQKLHFRSMKEKHTVSGLVAGSYSAYISLFHLTLFSTKTRRVNAEVNTEKQEDRS